jgi:hypothetical protein
VTDSLADCRWMDRYLFGVTGRRFTPAQQRLAHAIWSFTSYPDARIWNNRVAALAGAARSTGSLAVAAASAVSEAAIYGRGIDIRAIDFLLRTRAELAAGGELGPWVRHQLSAQRSLAGYGRPITTGVDERIGPILKLAGDLGLSGGPHLTIAFAVDEFLTSARLRLPINYGAVAAALSADLGMSAREYYLFTFPVFLAGMVPCYTDALDRPEGTLLPLPCDGVAYRGSPRRTWQSSLDEG